MFVDANEEIVFLWVSDDAAKGGVPAGTSAVSMAGGLQYRGVGDAPMLSDGVGGVPTGVSRAGGVQVDVPRVGVRSIARSSAL